MKGIYINMSENNVMPYAPAVFMVGTDYQIIFLTETNGIGWIEIGGERYTDEECGLLRCEKVHKIPVPGKKLNEARAYTVVFTEYADKKPYYPEGIEKIRKEYSFRPLTRDTFRVFQFADTHARVDSPLETARLAGDCDVIVLNGDINEWSCSIDNFTTSFALASGSSKGEIPLLYSRGNHDTRGYCATLLPDYIPTDFRKGRRETFYSFRQGPLWGVILDCGEDKYDVNPEYGGTINFDQFRKRETAYLKSLIENRASEYEADGVKYRLAVCHIPFTEHFDYPFDVADDIYEEWTLLLGEMGIDLLLAGHMHEAYVIPAGDIAHRSARFPSAVLSVPAIKNEDGGETYIGGLIEFSPEKRTARAFPYGASIDF